MAAITREMLRDCFKPIEKEPRFAFWVAENHRRMYGLHCRCEACVVADKLAADEWRTFEKDAVYGLR